MKSDVHCYAQPGKAKSRIVLEAFARGCGGRLCLSPPPSLRDEQGAAVFYGVVGMEHLLRQAQTEDREFYYGDNGYFDVARHRFFRFARNALQIAAPTIAPDYAKAKALGLAVQPWRRGGTHVVVVEQSEQFLGISGGGKNWLPRVVSDLKRHTERPLIIRRWMRDKAKAGATLRRDLDRAWALVTHMSAAANEALLYGVPVFVSGLCAASHLAGGSLDRIESPSYPEGREEWAARLAASQWTLDELQAGVAWQKLKATP